MSDAQGSSSVGDAECKLNLEDFKDATGPGPLLNGDWKCRKCLLLAADHPKQEPSASPVVITKPASLKKQEIPPPDRELIFRDEAYKVMAEYISGVNEDDIRVRSSDKEKGYKVLSTYGIQGLGKTTLFKAIFHNPNVLGIKKSVGSIMLTFNTMDRKVPDKLLPTTPQETQQCLAAMLMWAVGMSGAEVTLEDLKKADICPKIVLGWIRDLMGVDILLILVDELMKFPEAGEKQEGRSHFLKACIESMSKTFVFIFSAVILEDVQAWVKISGVGVSESTKLLPLLPADAVLEAIKTEAGDAAQLLDDRNVFRLLQQCMGHPRAVFDFFLPALRDLYKSSAGELAPTTVAKVLSSLDANLALPASLDEELVSRAISPLPKITSKDRVHYGHMGLMVEGVVIPVVLRKWAWTEANSARLLPMYLNLAFDFDDCAQLGTEKLAEFDFLYWDLARRVSLGSQPCTLEQLYNGALSHTDIGDINVTVMPTIFPASLLGRVSSFTTDNVANILLLLKQGQVVVSQNPTESAVEYLAPFFVDGKLHILGVQVKFEPKGKTFDVLDNKIKTKLQTLFPNHSIMSLILTTHLTEHRVLPEDSICYGLAGLEVYMKPLGPLRVLMEKADGSATKKAKTS